jgi:hypothetical protein
MRRSLVLALSLVIGGSLLYPVRAREQQAQGPGGSNRGPQTITARTNGMTKMDGYFPLYWDEATGSLFMEIPRFNTEFLYQVGLAAGLGSNDIGLDRAQLGATKIVEFERVGPRVMMVQPNYDYRADTTIALERKRVEEAFAKSIIWGFTVAAESDGRVLVDATDFVLRDAHGVAPRLGGGYRLDRTRSSIYTPRTKAFPQNSEVEVTTTFVSDGAGGGGGGRGGGGQIGGRVSDVTPSPEAVTVRQHHSFVQLPGPGFVARPYDARSSFFNIEYANFAAPLGTDPTVRITSRHRLAKKDPNAAMSDPFEPII